MTSNFDDDDNDEKIINWEEEATAIINDVKTHVAAIEIARKLPSSESNIYLNIRTIEGQDYCVHVSSAGFRVVAHAYDTIEEVSVPAEEEAAASTTASDETTTATDGTEAPSQTENEVYETPYALLDKISPRYVESFGNQLCKQLLSLQQMRTQFNEEDEEDLEEEEEDDVKAAT